MANSKRCQDQCQSEQGVKRKAWQTDTAYFLTGGKPAGVKRKGKEATCLCAATDLRNSHCESFVAQGKGLNQCGRGSNQRPWEKVNKNTPHLKMTRTMARSIIWCHFVGSK